MIVRTSRYAPYDDSGIRSKEYVIGVRPLLPPASNWGQTITSFFSDIAGSQPANLKLLATDTTFSLAPFYATFTPSLQIQ